jgi:hypothetical protein
MSDQGTLGMTGPDAPAPLAALDRRRLVIGLCLLAAAALLGFLTRRYLYNVLLGPFPIDPAVLSRCTEPDARSEYFVTFTAADVQRLCPYSYTGGQKPYAFYARARVAGRPLLVRMPADHEGEEFTGTLEKLSAYERQAIMAPLEPAGSGVSTRFLPFRLNANSYFRVVGYHTVVLPVGMLLIAAGWNLGQGVRRSRTPRRGLPFPPITWKAAAGCPVAGARGWQG